MKKLNSMLLAVAFAISSFATAGTGTNTEPLNSEENLTKEISQLLKSPSFEVQKESEAFVTFTLNDKSEIVVLSVDSKDEILEGYIKTRLNYKKVIIKGKSKAKVYKVPVRLVGE